MSSSATVIGLRKSFGFGDRLGCAGPGHLAALKGSLFTPVLAQQSIRELTRTQRSASEVMNAARKAVSDCGYNGIWGADADHLKTPADARRMADAGYTMFTIDPSEYVDNKADNAAVSELQGMVDRASEDLPGDVTPPDFTSYLGKTYSLGGKDFRYSQEDLLRAAVKYGRAVAHVEIISNAIAEACAGRPFEIEISIDETDSTTSPKDHLYVVLELKRRGVEFVSLAPRFVGGFEKGVDYKGNLQDFERDLTQHIEIARNFGPYKLSIHSGSDKFSIYPIIGRLCGDLLHVKTAGTSYLEALRVVCRRDEDLFADIARFSLGRFPQDKASYHISVTDAYVASLRLQSDAKWLEETFLDADAGRQILHVTFGSVLTQGAQENGRTFKDGILEILHANSDLHSELLQKHLGRHISELERG